MSTKTLKINPNLFKVGSKGDKKKEKVIKPKTKVKTGKVRDAFIQKIKDHRKKENKESIKNSDENLKSSKAT